METVDYLFSCNILSYWGMLFLWAFCVKSISHFYPSPGWQGCFLRLWLGGRAKEALALGKGLASHHSFLCCQMQWQPSCGDDTGFPGGWLWLCKQGRSWQRPESKIWKYSFNNSYKLYCCLNWLRFFNCPLKTEIQLVQSLGVDPNRIIYANPCKQVSQIKYASAHGVQMMTFDSEVELMKVARCHDNAK